jgi:Protein of unknown function (DUF4089)
MTEPEVLAYVKAAAFVARIPLDEAQAQRVAGHLTRTAEMAELLGQYPMGVEDELAEIYCPLPFLSAPTGHS